MRGVVVLRQQFLDEYETGNEQRDDAGQQSLLGDQRDDDVCDDGERGQFDFKGD